MQDDEYEEEFEEDDVGDEAINDDNDSEAEEEASFCTDLLLFGETLTYCSQVPSEPVENDFDPSDDSDDEEFYRRLRAGKAGAYVNILVFRWELTWITMVAYLIFRFSSIVPSVCTHSL